MILLMETFKLNFSLKSFVLFACFLIACNTNVENKALTVINQDKAVQIAETFVAQQGYTQQKTNITIEEAILEKEEYASNIENLLKIRYNVLKPKAYKARPFNNKTQWAVAFEFVEPSEEDQCRYVVMDTLGQNIYMNHIPTFLQWFDEYVE